MSKAPRLGRVKTRLAVSVGAVSATRFYRSNVAALVCRLGFDPRWRTVLAVSPDGDVATRSLPAGVARIAQGDGDLGRRMQRIMDRAPHGRVIIVGTDIPAISGADIAAALAALGRADAVFGPAPDGGYWLVGFNRVPKVPDGFKNVRWSSAHALDDTLANFGPGRSVAFLRSLEDVDSGASYRAVRGWSGRVVLPADLRARQWRHKS